VTCRIISGKLIEHIAFEACYLTDNKLLMNKEKRYMKNNSISGYLMYSRFFYAKMNM